MVMSAKAMVKAINKMVNIGVAMVKTAIKASKAFTAKVFKAIKSIKANKAAKAMIKASSLSRS